MQQQISTNKKQHDLQRVHSERVNYGVLYVVEWLRRMERLDAQLKQTEATSLTNQSTTVVDTSVWSVRNDLFNNCGREFDSETTTPLFQLHNDDSGDSLQPGFHMYMIEEIVQVPDVAHFYSFCDKYTSGTREPFSARMDFNLLTEYKKRVVTKHGEQQQQIGVNYPSSYTPEKPVYRLTEYERDRIIVGRVASRIIRDLCIIHTIHEIQQESTKKKTSTADKTVKRKNAAPVPLYSPIIEEELICLSHLQQSLALIYLIDNHGHSVASERWKQALHDLVTDKLLKTLSWLNERTRLYMQQHGTSIESCIKDIFQWISQHLQLIQQTWVTREHKLTRSSQRKQICDFIASESEDLSIRFMKSVKESAAGDIAFVKPEQLKSLNATIGIYIAPELLD